MLSPPALCLRCRAQRNGVAGAVRGWSSPKKFSSASYSTRTPLSNPRADLVRPLIRLSRPRTIGNAFSNPAFRGAVPQIRFQSSIVDKAGQVLGDPATAADVSDTPERSLESITSHLEAGGSWEIGFLSASGLDFGWGPSSMMMFLFEHIHVWSGLSVGASILVFAASWRFALFPLSMAASEMGTKMRSLQPQLKPIQERSQRAMVTGDQQERAKATQEYRAVLKKNDVKFWKMFLPMVQIPLGFGQWRVLRNMAFLPAPGMTNGGFLWFPNLIVHDPLFILPITTAAFQYLAVTYGGGSEQAEMNPQLQNFMRFGLPTITFIVVAAAPAAVQLSFCAGSFCALMTNVILRSGIGRKILGLTPRTQNSRGTTTVPSPYKGTITIDPAVRDKAMGRKIEAKSGSGSRTMSQRVGSVFNIRKHMTSLQDAVGKAVPMLRSNSSDRKKAWDSRRAKQRDEQLQTKRTKERNEQRRLWEQRHGQK